jgi:uncharacterized Zn finger protein
MSDTEHVYGKDCPHCAHSESETVDALIEGYGAMATIAIVECQSCGKLWGERRGFYGVRGK